MRMNVGIEERNTGSESTTAANTIVVSFVNEFELIASDGIPC